MYRLIGYQISHVESLDLTGYLSRVIEIYSTEMRNSSHIIDFSLETIGDYVM